MTRSVAAEPDIENLSEAWGDLASIDPRIAASAPEILSATDLLSMQISIPEMLIENVLPKRGASMLNGAPLADPAGNPLP